MSRSYVIIPRPGKPHLYRHNGVWRVFCPQSLASMDLAYHAATAALTANQQPTSEASWFREHSTPKARIGWWIP